MRFHWFHMFTNRTLIDFHNTWVKFLFLFIVTKFSIKPNLWNLRHKLIKHSSFSNNKIHNFPSIMYTPGDIREIMRRCIWNLLGKIFTLYDLKGILKQKLQTLLLSVTKLLTYSSIHVSTIIYGNEQKEDDHWYGC